MLEGIRDILELDGYEVATVTNGYEALAVMEQKTPDLVISDIMMPQMDGLQLCEHVRQNARWAMLPFIFLTAKGHKGDIRQGMRLGADDYLAKPFEPEDLLDAVEARLQRAESIKTHTMEEIEGLRETILHTLSHELRTPLTFVKGYTELLVEAASEISVDELGMFLQSIKMGSDRLSTLIEDFVCLISVETGAARLAYESEKYLLDPGALTREVMLALEEKARRKATVFVDRLPARLPLILGHRVFLTDALRRVLENAIKFSKAEACRVVVSSTITEQEVRLHIADNGVGIPEEELDRIFDKFYQVSREKMEQQGSGIGLSIVKGIMEMHDGRVDVESQAGEGSTFTLVLPLPTQS